jgi:hypothetical protein
MTKVTMFNGPRYAPVAEKLEARYKAVHAKILDGPDAELQLLIDDGTAWRLEESVGATAMAALESGACVCAAEPGYDFYGSRVPAYWQVADELGSAGSVANAEGYGVES